MTRKEKIQRLTNFLIMVFKKEGLFIQKSDGRIGNKFAIAELNENSGLQVHTDYMTYDEMNCYFLGVLSTQNNQLLY